MKKKRYYILTPSKVVTGGTELAHQMCCELRKMGCKAFMYYVQDKRKEPVNELVCEKYRRYGTEHVVDISEVEDENSVLVVPEGLTTWIWAVRKCKKVLWWMSVDNYLESPGHLDIEHIKKEVMIHLVQSQYAYNYLEKNGVLPEKILRLSDYISQSYGQFMLPADLRQNIALYNPKKGYEELKPIIDRVNWLKWMPLTGLSEEQMIFLMETAKIYVDFGEHPGKDRIPREAVVCGCCVITNKKGSAAFYEDIPIDDCYKIDNVSMEYDRIDALLTDICNNYEKHSERFEEYRQFVLSEKERFEKEVKEFVEFFDDGE